MHDREIRTVTIRSMAERVGCPRTRCCECGPRAESATVTGLTPHLRADPTIGQAAGRQQQQRLCPLHLGEPSIPATMTVLCCASPRARFIGSP